METAIEVVILIVGVVVVIFFSLCIVALIKVASESDRQDERRSDLEDRIAMMTERELEERDEGEETEGERDWIR